MFLKLPIYPSFIILPFFNYWHLTNNPTLYSTLLLSSITKSTQIKCSHWWDHIRNLLPSANGLTQHIHPSYITHLMYCSSCHSSSSTYHGLMNWEMKIKRITSWYSLKWYHDETNVDVGININIVLRDWNVMGLRISSLFLFQIHHYI